MPCIAPRAEGVGPAPDASHTQVTGRPGRHAARWPARCHTWQLSSLCSQAILPVEDSSCLPHPRTPGALPPCAPTHLEGRRSTPAWLLHTAATAQCSAGTGPALPGLSFSQAAAQVPMTHPIRWKDDRLLQPRHQGDAFTSVLFYEVLPRSLEQQQALRQLLVRPFPHPGRLLAGAACWRLLCRGMPGNMGNRAGRWHPRALRRRRQARSAAFCQQPLLAPKKQRSPCTGSLPCVLLVHDGGPEDQAWVPDKGAASAKAAPAAAAAAAAHQPGWLKARSLWTACRTSPCQASAPWQLAGAAPALTLSCR